MSPRALSAAWLLTVTLAFLPGCVTTPEPRLGDFTDQVLAPLSAAETEEIITTARNSIEQRYSGLPRGLIGTILGGAVGLGLYSDPLSGARIGGALGGTLDEARTLQREQAVAALEAQRAPLQQRVLKLAVERVRVEDGVHYTLCWEGKERRYEDRGAGFARLADGPGPCPTKQWTLEEVLQGPPAPK